MLTITRSVPRGGLVVESAIRCMHPRHGSDSLIRRAVVVVQKTIALRGDSDDAVSGGHERSLEVVGDFWVGLDGDTTNTVEQTGTEADCSSGTAVY